MNYSDTVNWMFKQLPMYQNKGVSAYKEDLSNTLKLVEYLKHPHQNFKSIHIAGTNGKGSTSHMLASVLQEAGYTVGLYTSPHLKDFRERIRINGKKVSKQFVIGFIKKHQEFFAENKLSFFEMTVGMAFDYFSKKKVDVAIIEVGLGGRLDSTNVITPVLSVITNIGYDHMKFLGDTLPKIASEKAGIIKSNIPVIIGETQLETVSVFKAKARASNSSIYFADELVVDIPKTDLKGHYQQRNAKTVSQTITILNEADLFEVSDAQLKKGLLHVVRNTKLKGRYQILNEQPKIICDTAHNTEGLSIVMRQLQNETYENMHIVFGAVSDKKMEDIMPVLPKHALYYLCKPHVQRGLEVSKLAAYFKQFHLNFGEYDSVAQALKSAKLKAKPNDLIYIGGSTFVVAEVI